MNPMKRVTRAMGAALFVASSAAWTQQPAPAAAPGTQPAPQAEPGGGVTIISGAPHAQRTAVAVPPFATAPGQESLGTELAGIVSYDLAFTGLYSVLPAQSYPPGFTGFTRDASQIDFAAWSKAGAELLVYAYVSLEGNTLSAECRLLDPAGSQQLVGKRFSATTRELYRLVAHQFSEEILLALTGTPGIATSEICFSGGTTGKKELCVADYDGANLRQITKHGSVSIMPQFSPNGSKIAYLSYKDRYPFLYVLDRATGKSTPLSKNAGLNLCPAWAPDGSKLAIVLSKDANEEIYLVNPDGSGKTRLTNDKSLDTSPAFSPDGRQIAFISERAGSPQVHAMDASGGNVRRLSFQGGRAYDPAWSPDGKWIAYVGERAGEGQEIYIADAANGANYTRLTNSAGTNEAPTWSPDSRYVMFASTRAGGSRLYTVNIETGQEFPVPNINKYCQGPSWGPRRK